MSTQQNDQPPAEIADKIQMYTVTLTHPDLDGPLVMDLIGSSPERAALRARHAAMHMYRHAELLESTTTVELSADQGKFA